MPSLDPDTNLKALEPQGPNVCNFKVQILTKNTWLGFKQIMVCLQLPGSVTTNMTQTSGKAVVRISICEIGAKVTHFASLSGLEQLLA